MLSSQWPSSGEGRRVKEAAERVSRLMDGQQPTKSLTRAYAELGIAASTLENLLENDFFIKYLSKLSPRRQQSRGENYATLIAELSASIRDDIQIFEEMPKSGRTAADFLHEITPPQKIGPIEFIFDGLLKIKHRSSIVGDHDRVATERSRDSLLSQGDWLKKNLRSLNCDKRIVELIEETLPLIEERRDVVALGMANVALSLMTAQCQEELAEAIFVRYQAFTVNIAMYIAQFPEWVRFSENAAMVEYSSQDVDAVYGAGQNLLSNLKRVEAAVDPEVPRTLRWMLDAMKNPGAAAKRSIFGAIRTIENFVIVVFDTFGEWLKSIDDGVNKGLKKTVPPIIAFGLLTAAADVATSVSPTAARVIQTAWLSEAARVVKEALPKLQ